MKERADPGFERFLSAGIDKDIEFTALLMMDNQRPVRLALQIVILTQRHNAQNARPVQASRRRMDSGGIAA